jgi:hypothetical protein
MPTVTEGILARIDSAFTEYEGIDISGNPGPEAYPFIVVDNLNFGEYRFNTKKFPDGSRPVEKEYNFQVTVAALDPIEASAIGARAYNTLLPANAQRPKINLDDGYEVNRLPVSGREYSQEGAGPSKLTVFYFQFDIRMYLGEIQ